MSCIENVGCCDFQQNDWKRFVVYKENLVRANQRLRFSNLDMSSHEIKAIKLFWIIIAEMHDNIHRRFRIKKQVCNVNQHALHELEGVFVIYSFGATVCIFV